MAAIIEWQAVSPLCENQGPAFRKELMRIRIVWITVAVAAASLAFSACGSSPVDPANNQTETFTGTIASGGVDVKTFSSRSGEYAVTFVSLSPPAQAIAFFTIFLGQNTPQGCA